MNTALLDCRESRYFYKGVYGQNVALGESNAEIGLTSATTTLHIFCVYSYDKKCPSFWEVPHGCPALIYMI